MVKKGSYALVIVLEKGNRLTVGRLGTFEFPSGLYLYMGSALNGLYSRVRRHIRHKKRLHWHVDYLTSGAAVEQVWYALGEERRECRWSAVALAEGAAVVAPGFGSSDCRCVTHLFHVRDEVLLDTIRGRLIEDCGESGSRLQVMDRSEDSRIFNTRESG